MATPTVVLVPVWGIGHFVPMLELGKRLLARSARPLTLTVVVMPEPEAARQSEMTEHIRQEEASGLPIRFHHLPLEPPPTDISGIEEYVSRYVQLYSPHVKAAVAGLPCPVAGVVVDIFCTTLFDAAHELGVPAYVYLIASAAMCALLLRSPALHEEVAGGVEFEEAGGGVVDVPGLPPVPASCLPSGLENRNITTYHWFLYNGTRYMEAAGIILNAVAEAEPRVLAAIADGRCTRGVPAPPVYPIGPVIPFTPPPAAAAAGEQQARHECLRWLDAQPPGSVVYLCFGGKGSFAAPQAHEIAHGVDRSGHRFLWVLRGRPEPGKKMPTDGNLGELLPAGFLERTEGRGLVWPAKAPQKEILGHAAVGGFVTHAGWNSVLESLWHGVPMVPWPLGAEQHYNAFTLVADMGVAVAMHVERKRNNAVAAAELERAVKALMGDAETAAKVRGKAREMKAVCRKAVDAGGSSDVSLQSLCHALIEGAVSPRK